MPRKPLATQILNISSSSTTAFEVALPATVYKRKPLLGLSFKLHHP